MKETERCLLDMQKNTLEYLEVTIIFRKRLNAGTVPANKEYAAGTVPANKEYGACPYVLAGHACGCWRSALGSGVPYNREKYGSLVCPPSSACMY